MQSRTKSSLGHVVTISNDSQIQLTIPANKFALCANFGLWSFASACLRPVRPHAPGCLRRAVRACGVEANPSGTAGPLDPPEVVRGTVPGGLAVRPTASCRRGFAGNPESCRNMQKPARGRFLAAPSRMLPSGLPATDYMAAGSFRRMSERCSSRSLRPSSTLLDLSQTLSSIRVTALEAPP